MTSLWERWQEKRIERQLINYTQEELSGRYEVSRRITGSGGYIDVLKGIGNILSYVKGLSIPTILDVGTGKAKAISDLRLGPYGQGLRFIGTGLVEYPETIDNLGGKENFRQTAGEFLAGIEDHSIGGIIAVYSVANSKAIGRVARQFDRVLIEGGVIKVNFHEQSRQRRFARALKKMGYDVATAWKPHITETLPKVSVTIVAVKPQKGERQFSTTAKQLLEADLNECENQNIALQLRRRS